MGLKHKIKDFITLRKNLNHVKTHLRQNTNSNTKFVLGDSHTDIFSKNTLNKATRIMGLKPMTELKVSMFNAPSFVCYHLGACLAYNTNKKNSRYNSFKKVKFLINSGLLPKGCTVICSFGEIDIRVHALKQAEKQNKPTSEIVDNIIRNYGEFLCFLKKHGYKVIAYGPIASQKDNIKIDELFPRYGSEIQRNEITKMFNDKLEVFCHDTGTGFRTLFPHLVTSDMQTRDEFLSTSDNVHLSTDTYTLVEKLFA